MSSAEDLLKVVLQRRNEALADACAETLLAEVLQRRRLSRRVHQQLLVRLWRSCVFCATFSIKKCAAAAAPSQILTTQQQLQSPGSLLFHALNCMRNAQRCLHCLQPFTDAHPKAQHTCDLQCPHCDTCFVSLTELRRHAQLRHLCLRYACSLCSRRFSFHNQLALHCKLRHNNANRSSTAAAPKVYTCICCEVTFISQWLLNAHIRRVLSGPVKVLKCRQCAVELHSLRSVQMHQHDVSLPTTCE